jgi:uncharacterized membrane protein HdeD (DUF308 family)
MREPVGNGLIVAETIVTFVGACIVLVRMFNVPGYVVSLLVGIGLLLAGLALRQTGNRR